MKLVDLLTGNSTAITGASKNAGKTTLLAALINEERRQIAVTSIGYDGESVDLATGTPKPRLFVRAGTVVITAEKALAQSDFTKRIDYAFGFNTPLGRVVAVTALSDGYAVLAGASTAQETAIVRRYTGELGVKLYVDGAISRRAFACTEVCDSLALCVGASYSNSIHDTLSHARHLVRILTLEKADASVIKAAVQGVEGHSIIDGALTDVGLSPLLKKNTLFIADSHDKILISAGLYEKLLALNCQIKVRNAARLSLVAANSYSATGASYQARSFFDQLRRIVPEDIPVIDVKNGFYR